MFLLFARLKTTYLWVMLIMSSLVTATVIPFDVHAQGAGDLLVAPTRVELEGRKRLAEVTLVNKGSVEATYRISFQNMHMTEEGRYEVIEEPKAGEKFADDIIRYAPRQVRLKAGESQTIRLMLRKPKGLEDGEYRSHLLFRAVPPDDTGRSIEDVKGSNKSLSVKLTPVFGISIPVIARHGKLVDGTATISNISLTPLKDQPAQDDDHTLYNFSAVFNRSGDTSLYGDVKIIHNGTIIGQLKGISTFAPYAKRQVDFSFNMPKSLSSGESLTVVYHDKKDEEKVYATTNVTVP